VVAHVSGQFEKEPVLDRFEKKISQVKRLENGQIYLLRIFDQKHVWSVEISGFVSQTPDLNHSYIFSKGFEIEQVLAESTHMYSDFVLGLKKEGVL
jgi:hypothetical protein